MMYYYCTAQYTWVFFYVDRDSDNRHYDNHFELSKSSLIHMRRQREYSRRPRRHLHHDGDAAAGGCVPDPALLFGTGGKNSGR
jgi:hypothetical protein